MKQKYYAVARGHKIGVYRTWDDCKMQVNHFSGAVYKSFSTREEAETFLNCKVNQQPDSGKMQAEKWTDAAGQDIAEQTEETVSTKDCLIAYVDGSYEHTRKQYAYGCVLVFQDELVTLNGSGCDEDYVTMRNVAGEILGSEQAVRWAVEHGYRKVCIYYDYEGIEKWADGIWKANKPGTRRYCAFIEEQRRHITISFRKVAAHTGVTYNEMADQLAKQALGL